MALTLSGTIVPTYDARGNLTSAGTTTYAYSAENMLTSASGGTSASLSYDPGLRLYQVTSGVTTTRFAYDGLAMIAEYDGSNALLRRYVHGPGMDQPLVWYEGTGTATRRWLHADERGSVGRFQYTGQTWPPCPSPAGRRRISKRWPRSSSRSI